MSSSHDDELIPSDSDYQQSAQLDPLLRRRSPSDSAQSDSDPSLNDNGSASTNSPPSAWRPDSTDVDMDEGNEESDPEDEPGDEAGVELEQAAERPNKYYGPPSTWRSWTEPERLLAASLDQIRAADLSIHLYNAHAMKRRLRTKQQQNTVPSWGNKERWIRTLNDREDSEDGNGKAKKSVFVPPKVWTAWPMPPDEVPREGEKRPGRWEDEDAVWTYKREGSGMPSESLQELLVAEVLKKAKERFRQREWGGGKEEEQMMDGKQEESRKRSRETSASAFESRDDASGSEGGRHVKPVIMTDDERAREILQPTIRHILAKLDDLLMGLHHARQAYRPTGEDTASESQTDTEDSSSGPGKRKARARRRSLRVAKKGGQTTQETTPIVDPICSDSDSNFNSSVADSSSPPRSRSRKRRRASLSPASASLIQQDRQKRLGLRDWSDVLGVGSMVGWDPAIIARAAERCAGLFGEGITFRTLYEGQRQDTETTYGSHAESNVKGLIQDSNSDSELEYDSKTLEQLRKPVAPTDDGLYYCPITDCKRHEKSFSREWNLRKHMREMHEVLESPELFGGIHVDGFLKPIQARYEWRRRETWN